MVLKVRGLKTHFFVRRGTVKAVDSVDFELEENETLGIVGESGCGKSVCAHSILRLIPPPGKIIAGEIFLNGKDILKLPRKKIPDIRGNEVSMIFQEPMTSLNPVFTIGRQISEVIQVHQKVHKKEAMDKAMQMLDLVGIIPAQKRLGDYPHQLSGGQRQRVMIAISLSCWPSLLIADEPTTALDVTIQAQILDLIRGLKDRHKTSVILISHDLGVIAEMAQKVMVMYAGKIMEYADIRPLFKQPHHPYTIGLMKAIPSISKKSFGTNLYEIPGTVPSLMDLPRGCKFNSRCDVKEDICAEEEPVLKDIGNNHFVRCWRV